MTIHRVGWPIVPQYSKSDQLVETVTQTIIRRELAKNVDGAMGRN